MNLIIFLPQVLESVHKLYEYKAFDIILFYPDLQKVLLFYRKHSITSFFEKKAENAVKDKKKDKRFTTEIHVMPTVSIQLLASKSSKEN